MLLPTALNGGSTRFGTPMLTAPPDRLLDAEQLDAITAIDPNHGRLHGRFLAELVAATLAHERAGVRLYRTASARALNPMLIGRFTEFERQTQDHVDILEDLCDDLGLDVGFVGPRARAVEAVDSALMGATITTSATLDPLTRETLLLDAVYLVETMCHHNWSILEALTDRIDDGPVRTALGRAIGRVGATEDEHLMWCEHTRQSLALFLATHPHAASLGDRLEELVTRFHLHI